MRGRALLIAAAAFPFIVAAADAAAQGESDAPPAIAGASVVVPARAARPKLAGVEKDPCFAIRDIEVRGLELADADDIRKAVEPLAHSCLGDVLAKAVIGAINEVHAAKGYVTTQGYVREQDIRASKRFIVTLVTGRVAKIVTRERNADEGFWDALKRTREADGPWGKLSGVSAMFDALDNRFDRFQLLGPKQFPGLKAWLATPEMGGQPLSIDVVQQGVDQLNRAASHKASAKLEPGEEPATSNVIYEIERKDSFRLAAGYEINGGALNGVGSTPHRARVDLAKDNLIGVNDSWSGSFASGPNSNETRAAFAMPIRWATLALSAGYSENLSPITPSAEYFMRKWVASANLGYVLSRSKAQQTSIEIGLNYRDPMRWINDLRLSRQTVAFARMGASHARYFENAQLTFAAGVSRGLGLFGAIRDPLGASDRTPRARFLKLDGAVSYAKKMPGIGVASVSASGQWSPKALYQDDQLVFGSLSSVRGFARDPAFADSGALVRAEFSPDLPLGFLDAKTTPFLADAANALKPYVFADYGAGWNVSTKERVSRASLGAGLRYHLGRLDFDVTGAFPAQWSGGQRSSRISRFEAYLNLSLKLF